MVTEIETTPPPSSEIATFYNGTNVFLTGATGFMGKMVMEKLLRACTGLNRIYLLMREKKGKEPKQRLTELLDYVFYEKLREAQPNVIDKLVIIRGDCFEPNLGISDEDRITLIKNVNCVIHCAATVRFDDPMRKAVNVNVRGTRDLLRLSREMESLKSFIHVSTAFSHCVRRSIGEHFYEVPISGEKLITLVDILDDEVLESITPTIIGEWPNTYVFTKAIAENVVQTEGKGLPIGIIRPSIVIGCLKEPIPGFNDNPFGATGVFMIAALGILRSLYCGPDRVADMVPADFLVNCTIAAAWSVGTTRGTTNKKSIQNGDDQADKAGADDDVPIYNYVSSVQKAITWRKINIVAEEQLKQVPTTQQVWHYCFTLNSNYYVHRCYVLLLHYLPAYIIDFLLFCVGKERMLVKGYKKIDKFMDVLSYFATQEWRFENTNTRGLWRKMNKDDRERFDFDISSLEWREAFSQFARGGRVYLLKDPLDTLPEGRRKYFRLRIAHYVVVTLFCLGMYKLFMVLWSAISS